MNTNKINNMGLDCTVRQDSVEYIKTGYGHKTDLGTL